MSKGMGAKTWEDPRRRQACGIPGPATHQLRGGVGVSLGPALGPRSRPSVLETRCTKLPSPPTLTPAERVLPHPRRRRAAPGRSPSLQAPPPPLALGSAGPGREARPYLFQVALAQARRCCVPRSSAAAAAAALLPRSLRLGELMNFNLRRVLMVTSLDGGLRAHALRAAPCATPRRGQAPAGAAPSTRKLGRKQEARAALPGAPGPAPPPRARRPPRRG